MSAKQMWSEYSNTKRPSLLTQISGSPIKICPTCGYEHYGYPPGFKSFVSAVDPEDPLQGTYFNCSCGSTLFVKRQERAV